jgi:hypothetical protein
VSHQQKADKSLAERYHSGTSRSLMAGCSPGVGCKSQDPLVYKFGCLLWRFDGLEKADPPAPRQGENEAGRDEVKVKIGVAAVSEGY